MLRKLLGYVALAAIIFWLVFSYLPGTLISLPSFSAPVAETGSFFQALLVASFILFLLLQFWLIRATVHMFRVPAHDAESTPQKFGLNLASELFWTAIPVLMTVGLAALCYRSWLALG